MLLLQENMQTLKHEYRTSVTDKENKHRQAARFKELYQNEQLLRQQMSERLQRATEKVHQSQILYV